MYFTEFFEESKNYVSKVSVRNLFICNNFYLIKDRVVDLELANSLLRKKKKKPSATAYTLISNLFSDINSPQLSEKKQITDIENSSKISLMTSKICFWSNKSSKFWYGKIDPDFDIDSTNFLKYVSGNEK
jgi:hypothetical protein